MPLTQVDQGLLNQFAQYTGFKNRIINGGMVIDQRNAGASVSFASAYNLDRWRGSFSSTTTAAANVQQNAGSVTPPSSFSNYLGITVTATESITGTSAVRLIQRIEGFNTADLAWGGASATAVTLSFWVRSSLTGTFGGNLRNSANNRIYIFSYSISAANTWEQKTITIAGDTSGTWLTNNGIGIDLWFSLGAGSSRTGTAGSWGATDLDAPTGQTNLFGTNGATFYITGVQLERGSTATSFDFRPYGTELMLCQRYCIVYRDPAGATPIATGVMFTSTRALPMLSFPVQMRAAPSATFAAAANYTAISNGGYTVSSIATNTTDVYGSLLDLTTSAATAGNAVYVRASASGATTIFSAEL